MARVLISVPENFLKNVDKIAESENRSRSELIREAIRQYAKKRQISERANINAALLENIL